ncbi:MAG: M20 family metallopeptidase [Candidatus Bathyarchaeota archaeon]|nr:M20 family metallopeptidase [Candidatus Bathyarchaeota archaeon]
MEYKEAARRSIDEHRDVLIGVSNRIHGEPELGHQEFKASALLVEALRGHGYEVELGVAGMKTAFVARGPLREGPTIGVLAEYDALPGIGHACGHNLIASAALGAAIGLSSVAKKLPGNVVIYGSPAEEGVVENAGGKVVMLEEIRKADAAIMVHPANMWGSYNKSNARESFLVEFYGKSSHAGGSPEKGVNALEGVIQTFNGVNALRQHISRDVRIHGIIKNGGASPNVVPDYASAHLYVRAPTMPMLDEYYRKVQNIIKGAELMTGARSKVTRVANPYANSLPSKTLTDLFRAEMIDVGVDFPEEKEPRQGGGSTDFGNVSQVMPALSAYVNIGNVTLHSPEGAAMTATPEAHDVMIKSAKALALTAIDLITKPGLLEAAKKEHAQRLAEQAKQPK